MSPAPGQRDELVRDLCGRLFAEPHRLTQTLTHQITERFLIAPHTHDDVLQFDLLLGCTGTAWSEGRATAITGTTAMVSTPGSEHGYELHPGERPSRVYHLKLRVEHDWPAAQATLFPPLLTGLPAIAALSAAMRGAARLGVVAQLRPPMLLVRVAEVLCLWPTGRGDDGRPAAAHEDDADLDGRLARAIDLMDRRLANPPTLDELARAAHFSPRHFARRFRRLYGCTPHTYLTARRFALARQMLTQDRLSVTQIAEHLGFTSVATFSRWFTQHAGTSPSAYREDPTVM